MENTLIYIAFALNNFFKLYNAMNFEQFNSFSKILTVCYNSNNYNFFLLQKQLKNIYCFHMYYPKLHSNNQCGDKSTKTFESLNNTNEIVLRLAVA